MGEITFRLPGIFDISLYQDSLKKKEKHKRDGEENQSARVFHGQDLLFPFFDIQRSLSIVIRIIRHKAAGKVPVKSE
jgi:hypothetical protein